MSRRARLTAAAAAISIAAAGLLTGCGSTAPCNLKADGGSDFVSVHITPHVYTPHIAPRPAPRFAKPNVTTPRSGTNTYHQTPTTHFWPFFWGTHSGANSCRTGLK